MVFKIMCWYFKMVWGVRRPSIVFVASWRLLLCTGTIQQLLGLFQLPRLRSPSRERGMRRWTRRWSWPVPQPTATLPPPSHGYPRAAGRPTPAQRTHLTAAKSPSLRSIFGWREPMTSSSTRVQRPMILELSQRLRRSEFCVSDRTCIK